MTAPPCVPTTFTTPWFGRPGALEPLPVSDRGYSYAMSRAAVAHTLASGGTAVTRRRWPKRVYQFTYTDRLQTDLDVLHAYYSGVMGNGPWCLVDPAWMNNLDEDTSTFGRRGLGTGWLALGTGSGAVDATVTPPPLAARSAVLRWTGAVAAASSLAAGVASGANVDADPLFAPPALPGMTVCMSVWARTASGTCTVTGSILSRNGDGSLFSSTLAATVTLTTTWQRITMAAATSSSSTTKYVLPSLATPSGSGLPDILVAAAQVEYGVTSPRQFVVGAHAPRVTFADPSTLSSSVFYRRTGGYTLAEN